jgi:DnaJ-like protein
MDARTERRHQLRSKPLPAQRDLTIISQEGPVRSMMTVKLLDYNDECLSVEAGNRLAEGTFAEIVGEVERSGGRQTLDRQGYVRRVTPVGRGRFAICLFLSGETNKAIPDYYEFLQISPNAEPATISRVYRFLASRFHPDIPGTGDADKFVLLKEAYDVLSDPERRARYDETYKKQAPEPVPLSNSVDFMNTNDGEFNRRVAVLALLYIQRRIKPFTPEVALAEVERRMGFPRDYLDFTMWYLKSRQYITIADNSDFTITALGVDVVESNREKIPLLNRLLSDRAGGPATAGGVGREVDGTSLITPGKSVLELPGDGSTEGIVHRRKTEI